MQIIHRDFSIEKFSFLSRKSTSLNLELSAKQKENHINKSFIM